MKPINRFLVGLFVAVVAFGYWTQSSPSLQAATEAEYMELQRLIWEERFRATIIPMIQKLEAKLDRTVTPGSTTGAPGQPVGSDPKIEAKLDRTEQRLSSIATMIQKLEAKLDKLERKVDMLKPR